MGDIRRLRPYKVNFILMGENLRTVTLLLLMLLLCGCNKKDTGQGNEGAIPQRSDDDSGTTVAPAGGRLDAYSSNVSEDENNKKTLSKKFAEAWAAAMSDTVLSALRLAFGGESGETVDAIYAIIKKEMDLIVEKYTFSEHARVGFAIRHKDNNYITAVFDGYIYPGIPAPVYEPRVLWHIMADIKNKKKLALSDIVNIDDRFAELVFKGLDDDLRKDHEYAAFINEYIDSHYPAEKRKDILRGAYVYADGLTPNITSCFDAMGLVTCFYAGYGGDRFRCIRLPLSTIRTTVILPDFPDPPAPPCGGIAAIKSKYGRARLLFAMSVLLENKFKDFFIRRDSLIYHDRFDLHRRTEEIAVMEPVAVDSLLCAVKRMKGGEAMLERLGRWCSVFGIIDSMRVRFDEEANLCCEHYTVLLSNIPVIRPVLTAMVDTNIRDAHSFASSEITSFYYAVYTHLSGMTDKDVAAFRRTLLGLLNKNRKK